MGTHDCCYDKKCPLIPVCSKAFGKTGFPPCRASESGSVADTAALYPATDGCTCPTCVEIRGFARLKANSLPQEQTGNKCNDEIVWVRVAFNAIINPFDSGDDPDSWAKRRDAVIARLRAARWTL
jgi:hypothetical protein